MSRHCILVVDDSSLLREVLTEAFAQVDCEVTSAADGLEALKIIRASRPDLIVADILMPHMDGWALCEEVRRDPATRDVPFIFLTTESDVPKRIKGLEMGADDYVVKPFSKEELVARARRLLARCSPKAGAGEPASAETLALKGTTEHLAMADLLQALSANKQSGTLHLAGRSVASIYFREGRIVNAETQGLHGEKALFRIMAWPEARFDFEPGQPAREVEDVIASSTSTLLMEGFAHLDELRDAVAALPGPGESLRVPSKKAKGLNKLTLNTTERLILFTAGVKGAPVTEIVDKVPDRDLAVYSAVGDLLRRGLLELTQGR